MQCGTVVFIQEMKTAVSLIFNCAFIFQFLVWYFCPACTQWILLGVITSRLI